MGGRWRGAGGEARFPRHATANAPRTSLRMLIVAMIRRVRYPRAEGEACGVNGRAIQTGGSARTAVGTSAPSASEHRRSDWRILHYPHRRARLIRHPLHLFRAKGHRIRDD